MKKSSGKLKRLLLVGDSMIEFGDWNFYLPEREVANLGRSGEEVAELRQRADRIVLRQQEPDLVLVMIGTNDVARDRFDFLGDYGEILAGFKKAWPAALLVVNSLLPMDLYYLAPDALARVNDSLRRLAEQAGIFYLDAWKALTDADGLTLPGVLADEVHLTESGYRLWAACLREFLAGIEAGER